MQKLRIGDKIKVVHLGKEENQVYTILDILEDYDGSTYWMRDEKGVPILEMETSQTKFEKIEVSRTTI